METELDSRATSSFTGAPKTKQPPYLIYHDGNPGVGDRTFDILANLEHIESLPFDGIAIDIPASWQVMGGQPLNYAQVYQDWLKPLEGKFQNLQHNFLMAYVDKPADPFDNWDTTIENWRILARLAKAAGLKGIFFDNEEYQRKLFNYPDDIDYPGRYSAAEYQAQMRRRGQQIMQAMVQEFPEIKVLVFHGPYISEPQTPDWLKARQVGAADQYELDGAFFTGLVAGMGPKSSVIDGGELYGYRTEQQFKESYDWRKYTLPSDEIDSQIIPPNLRSEWSDRVGISYGVYDLPFPSDMRMNPTIMQTVLERSLNAADEYVWYYSEGQNWLKPGGVTSAWINAVTEAQANVANGQELIQGNAGSDRLLGGGGNDHLRGMVGSDELRGHSGNDTLLGGAGSDQLWGLAGADSLNGGTGDDLLSGGTGADTLIGGQGSDRFVFDARSTGSAFTSSAFNPDLIRDFVAAVDKIALDKQAFTALQSQVGEGFSLAKEFAIAASNAAAGTNRALIVYIPTTGNLFYNPNGAASGFANGGLVATLTNTPVLSSSDFLIVD
jgi:hypothetical protein